MSQVEIRAALEAALVAITPTITTQLENDPDIVPVSGVPYQVAYLLWARPDDAEIGARPLKLGFMQVTLAYPNGKGTGVAESRAGLLETSFYRGRSLVAGSTLVTITNTPEIMPGFEDGDRWKVPVRIRWNAQT